MTKNRRNSSQEIFHLSNHASTKTAKLKCLVSLNQLVTCSVDMQVTCAGSHVQPQASGLSGITHPR